MGVLREQLMLFMGDSPADNPSPWLVTKKDRTTTDTFGLSFYGWSKKLDRFGSSLKTYLASSPLPLTTFVRVWSISVTKSGSRGVPDRIARLKALGNAVVPAQVLPIFQAIMEVMNA